MLSAMNRRELLAGAASAVLVPRSLTASNPPTPTNPIGFFLVGDTHFLADKDNPKSLDARSAAVTSKLVDWLNSLPGSEIPAKAGGGRVLPPLGVIHAGDCIDTGDKANINMQATEWDAFADAYGLTGKDGKLRVPVYEVHGNHDSPRGDGLAIQKIIQRNQKRPGVTNLSKNGVHYSWDWGGVHFICLGIVVGQVAEVTRKRRYAPLGSLEFLIQDLKDKVGNSGKPVVITQHIDMIRYAQPLPVADSKAVGMEWDPADVKGYYDALRGYNIAAILYGHTHGRNVYRWDGTNKPAMTGIPTFNVDNSSHFHGKQQAFFYFEIHPTQLIVREYHTTDAWETGAWTPQTWTAPLRMGNG
ncbi:metallophosphoesterase family protein [Tuwongella immobilis]|uniref:Metallophosphoesterase: Metallophosphoesterase n=1 Tax=Tuwongella immobilis TaxID=692036 RepID=A0A6C2YV55_9BACT|nr:metallophosphoesterase [Tuwongella immobilis]VIP05386.1 metallophosphoesterase : Metallophosphoesterase OS=Pirellula staleyi (strain ATCC 27377 / DSM 6068 / ICPB 4128) GN=Psta_1259 PE=4 SV=1 [Tuwongella immobilis]VTS08128.1 metallophosphoesterase : Metallophosphoesterase OS=Pirellula staleyi (strain ATCC 27377 / DSM 6068 / ICPB 4128) GN=Psta_1259 PE=4 SV=1 [Tuwongella immobilis]